MLIQNDEMEYWRRIFKAEGHDDWVDAIDNPWDSLDMPVVVVEILTRRSQYIAHHLGVTYRENRGPGIPEQRESDEVS
jgi:hypothetical protein